MCVSGVLVLAGGGVSGAQGGRGGGAAGWRGMFISTGWGAFVLVADSESSVLVAELQGARGPFRLNQRCETRVFSAKVCMCAGLVWQPCASRVGVPWQGLLDCCAHVTYGVSSCSSLSQPPFNAPIQLTFASCCVRYTCTTASPISSPPHRASGRTWPGAPRTGSSSSRGFTGCGCGVGVGLGLGGQLPLCVGVQGPLRGVKGA